MKHDVAIVGGSLAGCTAAVLLALQGARVAVLERSPDPRTTTSASRAQPVHRVLTPGLVAQAAWAAARA